VRQRAREIVSQWDERRRGMGAIELLKLIFTLLLQFGPGLVKLAKEVYDMVESWSKSEEVKTGVKVAASVKQEKFTETLTAKAASAGKAVSPAKINLLREGVWAMNNKKKLG
jgi:hypothetical protein